MRTESKVDVAVSDEVLAAAIMKISDSVEAMQKSGLNRRAIVALIKDDTSLGKGTIEMVLDSLASLRKKYCR